MSNPYEAPTADPLAHPHPDPADHARMEDRGVARLVDVLAVVLTQVPRVVVDSWRWMADDGPGRGLSNQVAWAGVSALGIVLLVQWAGIAIQGQTLGKWLRGIRIVGLDGRPAGLFRGVVLRVFLLWLLIVFAVGTLVTAGLRIPMSSVWLWCLAMLPIYGQRRAVLHDLLAGTVVVTAR